ncbi:hypothetical protein AB205_0157500, partial [Aquarana catesbeiana]
MGGATGGSANIYGHPLSDLSHRQEIQRKIGFCPQIDINFELLTVKENLEVFAQIKGVPRSKVKSEVQTNADVQIYINNRHLRMGGLNFC